MTFPVVIKDGQKPVSAKVTKWGQLVVAPLDYNTSKFVKLDVPGTVYNFYGPISGQQFVIRIMRIKANRNVSNTVDAEVIIYEGSSDSAAGVDRILHEEAMIRGESSTMIDLNLLVAEGAYVNATTTDDDIYLTVMGYYAPVGSNS